MTKFKLPLHCLGAPLFVVAAFAGFVLGACQEAEEDEAGDEDGTEIQIPPEIDAACSSYCEKLALCNEETVMSECQEKCNGVLYACEEHQKNEALDQVEQCGEKDCLALPLCTVNAGVQCLTGLGL